MKLKQCKDAIFPVMVGFMMAVGQTFVFAGAAQAVPYLIDEAHTSVHFSVAHFERTTVRGRWTKVSGKIDFDASTQTGSADLTIDPDTVDTGLRVLDSVLRSAQFLDTEQYPTIRFVSTGFEFNADRLQAVSGMLTLHGSTLPVRLLADRFNCGEVKLLALRRYVCGGDFHFSFRRSEFGLKRFLPDVGDEVRIDLAIEASPANP